MRSAFLLAAFAPTAIAQGFTTDAPDAPAITDPVIVNPGTPVSIGEIQTIGDVGTGCYDSPLREEVVAINGTVTVLTTRGLYVEDDTAGVFVSYLLPTGTIEIGDVVDVVGVVEEAAGMTEIIDVTDLSLNTDGVAAPTPTDVSTGDVGTTCNAGGEAYEGMFLKYSNLAVEVPQNEDPVDMIRVTDGSSFAYVRNTFFVPGTGGASSSLAMLAGGFQVLTGWQLTSVSGILRFQNGVFVLVPRFEADVVPAETFSPVTTTAPTAAPTRVFEVQTNPPTSTDLPLLPEDDDDINNASAGLVAGGIVAGAFVGLTFTIAMKRKTLKRSLKDPHEHEEAPTNDSEVSPEGVEVEAKE